MNLEEVQAAIQAMTEALEDLGKAQKYAYDVGEAINEGRDPTEVPLPELSQNVVEVSKPKLTIVPSPDKSTKH